LTAVNERVITENLTIVNMKLSIVGVYAPNEDASVQDKEQYLELLSDTVNEIGNNREVILVADMSARRGKKLQHSMV
jgi:hypothetical protein